jgi:hypothetical protein
VCSLGSLVPRYLTLPGEEIFPGKTWPVPIRPVPMPPAWKLSPERSKQIGLAMKPFRVIQKKRSSMVITTEVYCLKMVHALMQERHICNATQSRDPIWSVNKCQSYIVSLFVEITAPKDFPGSRDRARWRRSARAPHL